MTGHHVTAGLDPIVKVIEKMELGWERATK
jgi:hypothetical protein